MIIKGVAVNVAGHPKLAHKRSSFNIFRSHLAIMKMDDDENLKPRQTASYGAEFHLLFPAELAFASFTRPRSEYHFKGEEIGYMSTVHGAAGRDGTQSYRTTEFQFNFSVDGESFSLDIQGGELVPVLSTFDTRWGNPSPISGFSIFMQLPLIDAAGIFYRDECAQERIDKALELLARRIGTKTV